jgi:NAD+ kinase
LSFALGSLGFLTNFDFNDYQSVMDAAIDTGIRVNLRMRFTCTVYRSIISEVGKKRKAVKKGDTGEILMKNVEKGGWEALECDSSAHLSAGGAKDKEIMCYSTRPTETFEVLNDLVIDRGPSPYVSLLELFGELLSNHPCEHDFLIQTLGDEHHMTTVQGDGLTIATPTGSTAYSVSIAYSADYTHD